MTATALATRRVLAREEWEPQARAHAERVDAVTAGRRERSARGESHAVEDFLYDYYSARPTQLRRWHPGPSIGLADAPEHAGWRHYRTAGGATEMDVDAFWAARGDTVAYVERLIGLTAGRPLHLGCFGMHEWAMVFRAAAEERRHDLPLRLGAEGTNAVVEANPLVCTHFDAFRFFTPEAAPRNSTQPTRSTQMDQEQPGCLHATMDLYKWCAKLAPAVPSELQQDCFELALEVRRVDMRASPYDVNCYGLAAIPVETVEGKREYAALQRDFAARAQMLRERILAACEAIRAMAGASASA